MNRKRLISIVLICVLFLTLTACAADSSTNMSTKETNETEKTAETTAASEFKPIAGLNYDGYEFRILDYDGSIQGWYAGMINEVAPPEENGDPINDSIYRRNIEVEELYNIKISIVPVADDSPAIVTSFFTKAILADEDLFDAVFLSGSAINGALNSKNMAYNLLTIPSLDLERSWWDQNSVKAMSIGNYLSAVIGDHNFYSAVAPEAIYVNKKLMKDYSIENLYQVVKDGKWTWDVMYDNMKKVAKDLNGDGIFNQEDQLGLECQSTRLYPAVNNSGEYITPKNKDDIPVLTKNLERISNIVDKVVPILRDTTTTVTSENIKGTFKNVYFDFIMPKFANNEILFHIDQLLFTFELRNMEADFAILPYPKFEESQSSYYSTISYWWSRFTVLPITCNDTERAGNILNAMGYYSQKHIMPAYYDISITNKLVRDEDSLDMINIILSNRIHDLANLYDWGGIRTLFGSIAVSGKANTFMSEFAKIETKVTAGIEKTLNQLMGE